MTTTTRVPHAAAFAPADPAPERWWGGHPFEYGEPLAPRPVPEDREIVPNRHSASAEAALLRWHETHDY